MSFCLSLKTDALALGKVDIFSPILSISVLSIQNIACFFECRDDEVGALPAHCVKFIYNIFVVYSRTPTQNSLLVGRTLLGGGHRY